MVGSSRPKSFVRVAQELSNPLHAILLTAAMLREDVTDLQQGVELDVIRAPAARARETQGSDPPRDWSGYRSALALGIAGGGRSRAHHDSCAARPLASADLALSLTCVLSEAGASRLLKLGPQKRERAAPMRSARVLSEARTGLSLCTKNDSCTTLQHQASVPAIRA